MSIFYNFRRGLSGQECIDELKSLFGDKAPCYSTVKNRFNEFNCGRSSLKDEFRKDAPKAAVVSENIDAVRELIMQDRHVTYREIEASFSTGLMNSIVADAYSKTSFVKLLQKRPLFQRKCMPCVY